MNPAPHADRDHDEQPIVIAPVPRPCRGCGVGEAQRHTDDCPAVIEAAAQAATPGAGTSPVDPLRVEEPRDATEAARLPAIDGHVRITAFVQRNHRRGGRWDPTNWAPTGKAAIDGLVDSGVLRDDSVRYVTGPDMRAGSVQPTNRLLLVIRRAEPEQEPTIRSAS